MTDPLYPNEELNRLERQVDNLISLVHLLGNENKALKTQQSNWTVERAKLIEKNELAKKPSRVDDWAAKSP